MNDLELRPESEDGLERTEGGLVVPVGTAPKKRRVFTNADWKKARRVIVLLHGLGVGTRFDCLECNERMIPMDSGNVIKCKCSEWHLPVPGGA